MHKGSCFDGPLVWREGIGHTDDEGEGDGVLWVEVVGSAVESVGYFAEGKDVTVAGFIHEFVGGDFDFAFAGDGIASVSGAHEGVANGFIGAAGVWFSAAPGSLGAWYG
jgi:hypothetical protein